jgi:hypothetical protein
MVTVVLVKTKLSKTIVPVVVVKKKKKKKKQKYNEKDTKKAEETFQWLNGVKFKLKMAKVKP